MSSRDEGPVYYREIQKNAYLTRIPNEVTGGKLKPLGSKKIPHKPLWTQFCVHNGRTPYLEQYPEPDSQATLTHRPLWRACLRTARHVTGSVKPHSGDQYDFLIDTDNGSIRMLAPDWEAMQDWVLTLRNTLHELKIVSRGENVYCSGPPAQPPPAAPRAAARDPTSPLPPTPPTPPDRVPGIDLTPNTRPQPIETAPIEPEPNPEPEPIIVDTPETEGNIDISNWEPFSSLPSTSQNRIEPKNSVAKICGQNICLDDSIFKRTSDGMESDDEFFANIDKEAIDYGVNGYKQRVVVSDVKVESTNENCVGTNQATNVTVIQVSNKEPPHTAIPVLGPETDVFDFEFKQNLTITDTQSSSFVNIVNTDYATTIKSESDYGHLSLTTTVSLTGQNDFPTSATVPTKSSTMLSMPTNEELYERLCLASTSKPSPLSIKKVKSIDNKNRKSSLPNLDVDSTYEYLFLGNNNSGLANSSSTSANLANASTSLANTANLANNSSIPRLNTSNLSNNPSNINSITLTCDTNVLNNSANLANNAANLANNSANLANNTANLANNSANLVNEVNSNSASHRLNNSINQDPLNRVRSVERSRSQNAYDAHRGRDRENLVSGVQNISPKREIKNDKSDASQPKPIWRRGLTELSLLTRLRSLGQVKRLESPTRNDKDHQERVPVVSSSPAKVVHRSRPEVRVDSSRRRSSSLSNGVAPPIPAVPQLQSLRARQAAELRLEQRRGAALVAELTTRQPPPLLADYNNQVWVSRWLGPSSRWCGRGGDRLVAVRGLQPTDANHAALLLHNARAPRIDVLFHRVPLANIYVLNKRDRESLGIKLDNECNITSVENDSPASRAGLPPPGKWAVTEVNNRPINLVKGGEDDMNRLSMHGSEVSILIQPSALVKKLRASLKANKTLLGLR